MMAVRTAIPKTKPRPNSLTYDELAHVSYVLTNFAQTEAALIRPCPFTQDEIFEMLFPHVPFGLVKTLRSYLLHTNTIETYHLPDSALHGPAALIVNYAQTSYVPLRRHMVQRPSDALSMYVADIERIFLKYEEVRLVVNALSKRLSRLAIRYHWPAILRLLKPASAADMGKGKDTTAMDPVLLPAMRSAAATVAGAALLPPSIERPASGTIRLFFAPRRLPSSVPPFSDTKTGSFNLV